LATEAQRPGEIWFSAAKRTERQSNLSASEPLWQEGKIKFQLQNTSDHARLGELATPHGLVRTPAFMPVGTQGTVKAMTPQGLGDAGAEIILGNAYHLYLRPGLETVRRLGGLQKFTGWNRPMLTDSGGYQVFSLAELRRIREEGVEFQSHLDGSTHAFTPESVTELQMGLGADIIMCFDECIPYPSSRQYTDESTARTTRWARRCREAFQERAGGDGAAGQALFGIVQGGVHRELRRRSAQELVEMGFDGYAVGGLAIGEPKEATWEAVEAAAECLPHDRPRYMMGVGFPEDIIQGASLGIDMFDCVMPTRNARTGTLFTSRGRLAIKNARHAEDPGPVDGDCGCYLCRNFSRAYLRHLFMSGEMAGAMLATLHNLRFYLGMMEAMRKAIGEGRFEGWRAGFLSRYSGG
jgi:queuine tRNA-ribosyltransferase